ncbi:hypothetical protein [Intrasporangium sp. YIM S08009]|uniref:hypothetical protein n=1 Tax=Intrasporangium zincisolvens TaxID=3080018 RepID=UPI002B05CD34|nr:hypothetical protein [Intrasporangium sp. YIM S08009]
MRIGIVLADLHHDENELARALLRLSDEHRADHEVHYVARDLAEWSSGHVREIARIASQFDQQLDPVPDESPTLVEHARMWMSERAGRSDATELVMVRALRDVYLRASSVLADWEMVGQAAQAIVHDELMDLAARCGGQAKRQAHWANAKIKESSTQALVV